MQDPMPSGWFPDPLGRYDHRYFNGVTWTSDVSLHGQRLVDPLGVAPGAPGGAGTPNYTGASGASNGAATAAVVMGSIALVVAWIPFLVVIGLTLAVLAIVFGLRGRRRAATTGRGRGAAVAGTVMGVLGLAASAVGIWLTVVVWNEVVDFVEPGPHQAEVVSCTTDGRQVVVEGRITNLDDTTNSYVVFVEVADAIEPSIVDDVPAGASVDWRASLTTRSALGACDATITVQGPFPFGLEMDPVNGAIAP